MGLLYILLVAYILAVNFYAFLLVKSLRDKEHGNIAVALDSLRIESRNLFYADHPEAKRRLEELSND